MWSYSSWTLQSPQCVLYPCLWERPTVVSLVGHKQTEPWMPGEAAAAHWAQGWAPNVAAEPLQNEPLAGALPTGNVSSPAMWNRFQLEGTRAQSQCLEIQLSVLCFFLVACAVLKTLTHILTHHTVTECTKDLIKTTMLLILCPHQLYYLMP